MSDPDQARPFMPLSDFSGAEPRTAETPKPQENAPAPKLVLPGLDREAPGEKVRLSTQMAPDAWLYLTNYMQLARFDHVSEALEKILRWMAELDERLKLAPSDPRLKPLRSTRTIPTPPVKKRGRPKKRSLES